MGAEKEFGASTRQWIETAAISRMNLIRRPVHRIKKPPSRPMRPRIAWQSGSSSRPTHIAPTAATRKVRWTLFTADAHFVVYMNAKDPKPSQELHSRAALAPVFDRAQQVCRDHALRWTRARLLTLTSDRATGEAYTLAHHVTVDGEKRRLMVAALRYLDTFVKTDGNGCSRSACSTSTGSSSAHCDDVSCDDQPL